MTEPADAPKEGIPEPPAVTTQPEPPWQLEYAWKTMDLVIGFSKHFDSKPGPMLAMTSVIAALATFRIREVTAVRLTTTSSHWAYQFDFWLSLGLFVPIAIAYWTLLKGVVPSLKSGARVFSAKNTNNRDSKATSLVFFDDIARTFPKLDQSGEPDTRWWAALSKYDFELLGADISDQVLENARIVQEKANHIRVAGVWIVRSIALAVVCLLFLPIMQYLGIAPILASKP